MKKILLIIILFLIFIPNISATTDTAKEYILMDMTSGRVLQGKNYNTPMLIASITNIMTI